MSAGQFVQIHTFHQHITAFLAFGLGNASHIAHFGGNHGIFEIMRFVHHQAVYAKILKGNNIILALLVVELIQLFLDLFSRALHLLDGKILGTGVFQKRYLLHNIVKLLLQVHMLAFFRKWNFLKLTMPYNNDVITTGSNAGAEFFSVFFFEIRFLRHQNFSVWVEQECFGRHLFGQMVGNHNQSFIAKAQPLFLHGAGYHLKCLACAHFMCQQDIVAIQHMSNGIQLVRAKGNFRVHARKFQVATVILAWA